MTQPLTTPPPTAAPPAGPRPGAPRKPWWILGAVVVLVLAALVIAAANAAAPQVSTPTPTPAPAVRAAATIPAGATSSTGGTHAAAYLAVLADAGLLDGVPEDQALTLGHTVCTFLAAGNTIYDAGEVAMASGFTPTQAGTLVGTAIAAFCPRFAGQF